MHPEKKYMLAAIRSALKGVSKKEGGPFGAVIVDKNGHILSTAHNTVWKDTNPTAHAEVNAIRKACKKLGSINLSGCTIYSTTEPCPMCFSAIHWARIGTIVYGASIEDAAKYGFNEMKVKNTALKRSGKLRITIISDFMREDNLKLFRVWKNTKGHPY